MNYSARNGETNHFDIELRLDPEKKKDIFSLFLPHFRRDVVHLLLFPSRLICKGGVESHCSILSLSSFPIFFKSPFSQPEN